MFADLGRLRYISCKLSRMSCVAELYDRVNGGRIDTQATILYVYLDESRRISGPGV